jgi:integrase
MARNPKGSVAIETVENRIRLRWRWQGRQETIAIGAAGNKVVLTLAQKIARQIELDLLSGNYDSTKERYAVTERPKRSALELWDDFTVARGMQRDSKYRALRGYWLNDNKPVDRIGTEQAAIFLNKRIGGAISTRRSYRSLLSACWEWAKLEDPWKDIKLPKSPPPNPDPFLESEVKLILEGFAESYYRNFVIGLLTTGCRPGELAALTWGDILWTRDEIYIHKAWSTAEHRVKTTKTGKERFVPLLDVLRSLLEELLEYLKPEDAESDDLIFPGPEGAYLDTKNFLKRHWKPTLKRMGVRYRSTYRARHTVWSHSINDGMSIADAAKYAGNRPETMLRNYLGSVGKSKMTDLISDDDED